MQIFVLHLKDVRLYLFFSLTSDCTGVRVLIGPGLRPLTGQQFCMMCSSCSCQHNVESMHSNTCVRLSHITHVYLDICLLLNVCFFLSYIFVLAYVSLFYPSFHYQPLCACFFNNHFWFSNSLISDDLVLLTVELLNLLVSYHKYIVLHYHSGSYQSALHSLGLH